MMIISYRRQRAVLSVVLLLSVAPTAAAAAHPDVPAVPSVPSDSASATPSPSPTPTADGEQAIAPASIPVAGVPDGIELTPLGPQNITEAGAVIDGADISGQVVINAPGVVIRNSRVSGVGGLGIYVNTGSVTVSDTTIEGFDDSIGGDNYTALRVEVTGAGSDGFKVGSNVLIEDSWCHDIGTAPEAHADCAQVQSGVVNTTLRGNWLDVGSGEGNAALFIAPDLGPSAAGPLLVEGNVLGGGNFNLYCVDGSDGDYYIEDITISGNVFMPDSRYGPLRVNVPVTLVDNVLQDTGEIVS